MTLHQKYVYDREGSVTIRLIHFLHKLDVKCGILSVNLSKGMIQDGGMGVRYILEVVTR